MAEQITKVVISSTTIDLPEHREEVKTACLEQGMFPVMMEQEPATTAEAISLSEALVDGAKIYIGVYAHRYGHQPEGSDISITEIEYERALDRGITRLIFLMHEDHPVKASTVEKGDGAAKLDAFKARLKTEQFVKEFKSAAELRAHVVNSLAKYQQGTLLTSRYVITIPPPPQPYIAHPDSPFQLQELVGRRDELRMLTDWVSNSGRRINKNRIMLVVAAGGMGKSLLAWKWFKDVAQFEMPGIAGRVWWSFGNGDRFGDFIKCTLAYVSGQPLKALRHASVDDCRQRLLNALNEKPFLIVLDSLEHLLDAYAHTEAASLVDDERQQRTSKDIISQRRLPVSRLHSFVGQHRLRSISDPQIVDFLRQLTRVRAARTLITTRLYPADLQGADLSETSGCKALFLKGLSKEDAVNMWRACNASGSRKVLLSLFRSFNYYPVLIREMAEKVAQYRHTPNDREQWRQDFPEIDV